MHRVNVNECDDSTPKLGTNWVPLINNLMSNKLCKSSVSNTKNIHPREAHRWDMTCSKRWQRASYQIRKIVGCACAGNAGNVFSRQFQRKPLFSDPGMHHGTCVTHVPWCMSGSLTCGDGESVPGIPGACASAILRIWQEAHGKYYCRL